MEILHYLGNILHYAVSFAIIISIIVFVHEFGHFIIARICGVKIDEFSIGFGKEIFGWNDKRGTRWKVSLLPLGGFVKMHGDSSEASTPDTKKLNKMSEAEKAISFHYKPLWQKFAVVLAGPVFNFAFSILVFIMIFMAFGKLQLDAPIVNSVTKGGAAEKIKLMPGDVITELDGKPVKNFSQIPEIVKARKADVLDITYKRGEQVVNDKIAPTIEEAKDAKGNIVKVGRLGIQSFPIAFDKNTPRLNIIEATKEAIAQVYNQSAGMLKGLGQMVNGTRSSKELGGPVKIMEYSGNSTSKITAAISCALSDEGKDCGQLAREGLVVALLFMTMLSTMLGLVNLFPIPMLDGGHLLLYTIQGIIGRPLGDKAQEWLFRFGFCFLISLMLYATYNDIVSFF